MKIIPASSQFLFTVAATMLISLGLLDERVVAEPGAGEWGKPRLLVAAPADAVWKHLSWPKMVRTAEGTLILAYSAGAGHNVGGSGPAVSLSTDGGRSFTPPRLLRRFPDDDPRYRDCGNLALNIADDGAVVLLAMVTLWTAELPALDWRPVGRALQWTGDQPEHVDFTYPWMTHLEDDRWMLVCYSGQRRGRNDIYGLTLRLDPQREMAQTD